MLKQVMNNNKLKFYILFCVIYVTQLSQCKVAYRREDGTETNAVQDNSIADDGPEAKEDQPSLNEADGPNEDMPISAESAGPKEDMPISAENAGPQEEESDAINADGPIEGKSNRIDAAGGKNRNGCWISLHEQSHFKKMSQLEQQYKDARDAFEKHVNTQELDSKMVAPMALTRGIAERALQKFDGNPNVIPAGLNLGSYCMMRMPGSILFFSRLKLRNDTRFTVNFIHNDMKQLTLTLRLSLNDLHLVGEYERALTGKEDPSQLFYRPNQGEVEFLLQNVQYKMEGRYRLLDGRLHLEHVISEIPPMQILMRYTPDGEGKSTPLDPYILRDYLDRMQVDLDYWLKDYFNDFLMLYSTGELNMNNEIQQYENEKTILLNQFSDQVMDILNNRIKEQGSDLMMPNFVLTAANGMQVRLYDGVVRGLDTMYRRSVATSKFDKRVRFIDADIGFSKLKSEYRYDVYVKTGMPPVSGVFVLDSEDVTAHMALQIVGYKPSVPDLLITYKKCGKPESLTVEGPASRIIANFKHLLEHHIISIMSSTLIHHIRSLSSLTKCVPQLAVKNDRDTFSERTERNEDYDFTTPIQTKDETEPPNDDYDEPTEQPDNTNDDRPSERPDNENNDDGPTELPDNENNDDGPTELPDNEYNDDGPTQLPNNENDDDGPTELPDNENNDDGPTELPDNENDDDGPTELPDNENNDDGPTELPDNENDDDGPTELPDNENDDDGPTELPDNENNDDGPTELPDNNDNNDDDNEPTEPQEYNKDDAPTEPPYPNDKKPEYAFDRKESIELELPPKDGSALGESYKIDHNETFSLTKLNNDGEGWNGEAEYMSPPKNDYRGKLKLSDEDA